jgi:hypothetical protein
MWEVLQQDHQKQPYHLMLMGGDQLYADGVWDEVPSLKEWQELPAKEKLRMPFSPRMAHEVSLFYLKLYMHRWSQSPAAQMMSSIPCLMMWDDHDIFDGWGSWPENQVGAVHTGVYQVARKYFRLFQLQSAEGEKKAQFLNPDQNFSFAYRLGRSAIVAPDMRSERKPRQVMSRHSWKKLFAWMYKQAGNSNGQTEDCRHILLMSAIPIIYVNARYIERLLNWIPGQQPMEDDFRDQWLSHAHREERHWVVREFFGFVRETGCRITLLSGDVHVGCAGKLTYTHQNTGESYVIDQLVSSAMVNFPPPAPMVYAMDKLAAVQENRIDENISARLVSLPGSRKRILGCRNYLSLQLDEQDRLQVNWQADSENKPCTLTIESLRHKTFLESLS